MHQYPGQHSQSLRSELVSLPGQALAVQTLSIKGREERVKEMGVMSSSVHSPGDHVEESLPLPLVLVMRLSYNRRKSAVQLFIS